MNISTKKKKIVGQVKFQIKAQQATPAPPVGPQIGQFGINLMGFCKEFNERTRSYPLGSPVPIIITIFQDKSFEFITRTLPSTYLIAQKAKTVGGKKVISQKDLKDIVEIKKVDLNSYNDEAALKTILGTARSMNISSEDQDEI